MKGSYILLIELASDKDILIGKSGYMHFPKAYYAYVGSAMNGFKARLAHHLRERRKPHWHIDYLLKEAEIIDIILCPSEQRTECFLAQALAKKFPSILGFGCTDCRCNSHLYFDADKGNLERGIIMAGKTISDHRGCN